MTATLVGLLGLVVGALLNEYIRRKHRIENYSQRVFDKRLSLYEELYSKLYAASVVASDVIDNHEYSKEDRHGLISQVVFGLAEFCDENSFYIEKEIALHVVGTFIGVENIHDSPKRKKEEATEHYREKLSQAFDMIKDEAGITELHKLFRSFTKAQPSSDLIEYYREVKSAQK